MRGRDSTFRRGEFANVNVFKLARGLWNAVVSYGPDSWMRSLMSTNGLVRTHRATDALLRIATRLRYSKLDAVEAVAKARNSMRQIFPRTLPVSVYAEGNEVTVSLQPRRTRSVP